uniref:Uncharacterized protein n=1 Tax=Candidatus Kentrum sp. TC TaxID=2126339 RepID=A0A450YFR5_9GAMM|nr:MAG: hypothetical protein BECKTC1821E_GA0114239_100718 [Candidatus Kentron sp. TC]
MDIIGVIIGIFAIPKKRAFFRWYRTLPHRLHEPIKTETTPPGTNVFPNASAIPASQSPTDPPPYDPTRFAASLAFRGRVRELRQLSRHMEVGESVLIEGDFRIGKISLLRIWEIRAIDSGREVRGLERVTRSPAALGPQGKL